MMHTIHHLFNLTLLELKKLNAVEENKGRVKLQENKAYQPTTDLHLICSPANGTSTDAANAPEISTEANMAYEQTNLIDGHLEVAVLEITTAEESGARATAVYVNVPETVEECIGRTA